MSPSVVIVGAGIVGVSTGIWLRRMGAEVTLIDRGAPGQGTSYGNAGVLAACSMVPVTGPGLLRKAPAMLANPDVPLFLRWSYLPKLAPWLIRYMRNANDGDTRRIARGLTQIVGDSVAQHRALSEGTRAAALMREGDYVFAYPDRAAFDAEHYTWELRRDAGFVPELIDGADVQDYDPALGPAITCVARLPDHGHIRDPGGYVAALAADLVDLGGRMVQAEVRDFDLVDGILRAVDTDQGRFPCDCAVLATGVWSRRLMAKIGLNIPLETERGYHILFENAEGGPQHPTMISSGKFVATPMERGVRCAGILEFGGLEAGSSQAPLALLRRHVAAALPHLKATGEEEWLGHRPAPSDSLPLIGETTVKGLHTAFGHHHIGLTGGPKTGRLLAGMLTGHHPNIDMSPYDPRRFR
ncbi:MAG: FAD-dependent oxidoreductase [Pseudomonadota bacterium]